MTIKSNLTVKKLEYDWEMTVTIKSNLTVKTVEYYWEMTVTIKSNLTVKTLEYDCEMPKSPGPEVIKLFSSSTQPSMKFQLLIKTKVLKNDDFSYFQTLSLCIYPTNSC